jgi:TolB-like protein/DNA-binding winged helix-turn-helix (wHTH) protein
MKSFQSFRLDAANHSLWREEERVQITPKAFDVLRYMVEHAGSLVTQDELLEALWPKTYINPEVVRKYILEIRKVLGDRPDKPQFIETVTKRGYRFVASVTDESVAQPLNLLGPSVTQELAGTEPALSERESHSGEDRLRRLAAATVLVGIVAAAITGYFWFGRNRPNAPSLSNTSIAVLPFVDLSPNKDQEYFSDGLAEELINDLAKVQGMRVVARSSAFQFKGKNEDLRSVGRKLGVANILEGSMQREGDHVRIRAELIKAEDGFQLWSETYDRKVDDIFAVEDEIARAATGALQVKLLAPSGTAVSRSTNPEAYQAYLEAQAFFGSGEDKGNLERALAYTDQAIKLDPKYAPAWALRSYVLNLMAAYNLTDMAQGYGRARQDAERAIALDPSLATGYLALGWIQMSYDWDWERAQASLNKAAELEPGNIEVLRYRSSLYRTLGRLNEAIELYEEVVERDPLRARGYSSLGNQFYSVGQYDKADAMLQKALELNPQKEHDHTALGLVLLARGRPQQALTEMEREPSEDWKLFGEALAYHSLGRSRDSDAALEKLIVTRQTEWAVQIAQIYVYRGELEKAFEWLDRAYRQHDGGLTFLKVDPILKSLHQDPRYTELLKKMHLPT